MWFETKTQKRERLLFRLIDDYGYDPIKACQVAQTMGDVIAGVPITVSVPISPPDEISCTLDELSYGLPLNYSAEPVSKPNTAPEPIPKPKPEPEPEPERHTGGVVKIKPGTIINPQPECVVKTAPKKSKPAASQVALPDDAEVPEQPAPKGKRIPWSEEEDGFILQCLDHGMTHGKMAGYLPWRTTAAMTFRVRNTLKPKPEAQTKPAPVKVHHAKQSTPAAPVSVLVTSTAPVGKQSFQRQDGRENANVGKIIHFLRSRDFTVVEQTGDHNQPVWKVDGTVYNKPKLLDFANARRERLELPLYVYGV